MLVRLYAISSAMVVDGLIVKYQVTEIRFHEIHVVYMYNVVLSDDDHVVLSDGDEQDYWNYELEMIKCHCYEN